MAAFRGTFLAIADDFYVFGRRPWSRGPDRRETVHIPMFRQANVAGLQAGLTLVTQEKLRVIVTGTGGMSQTYRGLSRSALGSALIPVIESLRHRPPSITMYAVQPEKRGTPTKYGHRWRVA